MSNPLKGRKRPKEVGEKISKSKMGHPVSEETKRKISLTLQGRTFSKEVIKRRTETRTKNGNNKQSEKTKRKLRIAHLGKPKKKGKQSEGAKKRWSKEEERKAQKQRRLGTHQTEKTKHKCRETQKQLWMNLEWKEKHLKAIAKGANYKPNKPELMLLDILQKLFPNKWEYVGNRKIWIGCKNPDFIHTSEKKIIELFGDYWHSEKKISIPKEQHEQERKNAFTKFGYVTLIIWEHELKDVEKIIERLVNFNESGS